MASWNLEVWSGRSKWWTIGPATEPIRSQPATNSVGFLFSQSSGVGGAVSQIACRQQRNPRNQIRAHRLGDRCCIFVYGDRDGVGELLDSEVSEKWVVLDHPNISLLYAKLPPESPASARVCTEPARKLIGVKTMQGRDQSDRTNQVCCSTTHTDWLHQIWHQGLVGQQCHKIAVGMLPSTKSSKPSHHGMQQPICHGLLAHLSQLTRRLATRCPLQQLVASQSRDVHILGYIHGLCISSHPPSPSRLVLTHPIRCPQRGQHEPSQLAIVLSPKWLPTATLCHPTTQAPHPPPPPTTTTTQPPPTHHLPPGGQDL